MKSIISVTPLRIPFVGGAIANRLRFVAGFAITITGVSVSLAEAISIVKGVLA